MTDVSSSAGWKLQLCIVAVVFGGIARNGSLLADGQKVRTARPHDLPQLPVPTISTADQLPQINRVLAMPGDHHDAILDILRIGDATSVPFLIVALEREGVVPREGAYSTIDTRLHCLEALQRITNQDAGRNAEDWRSWYEANKGKTQEEWIRDGFAAHGFPVSSPPDDAFVTSLIRAADPRYGPSYVRTNALRMLKGVPADMLVRIAGPLAASPEVSDRRATVAALDNVVSETAIETLRGLKIDRDVEVAENALRTLNATLRKSLPTTAARPLWDMRLANASVAILHVLDRRTVVLGVGYGIVDRSRVVGFDLVSRRVLWT